MAYVGIILKLRDQFLIQLRDNNPQIANPNKWGLFGGSIEGEETPREAIKREIKEEINIDLEDRKLIEVYNNYNNFGFYYELNIKEEGNLKLGEGQKIGKFSIQKILNMKNITPGTREAFLKMRDLMRI